MIEKIVEGYRHAKKELDLLDKIANESDPSRIFHNPALKKEFDAIIDKRKEGALSFIGGQLYYLPNLVRILSGNYIRTYKLLNKAYDERIAELEKALESRKSQTPA